MAHKNILFPRELCYTYESNAGTVFNTTIAAPGGDTTEDRNAEWGENSRCYFNSVINVIDTANLKKLRSFFQIARGRTYSFLLEWPDDNVAIDALLLNLAGGTTFQLRQEYKHETFNCDGSLSDYEFAYKSVQSCCPATVYLSVNGQSVPVAENPDFGYLFNDPLYNQDNQLTASVSELGVITFSTALAATDEIRASFNFFYIVRFNTDDLKRSYVNFNAYSISAPMIEVKK